ncbi:alginate lyase family protein [Bacteroides helcogenes]|uniref:Glycosyl hydrolase family 88 n=1 Tax=Bacteroides helcogenes (strain ATCC 35417 / DSM 20613 / JCM 6297 / CCUG 15421 / P 36-108) TaxID=693979 RepID=E6SWM9_BACT6|nr:alginate lyase family protein [Bacteroides helcogenes]ADV42627.1 glycosyl hydrolase family 88 [Bacteroides helcogenes P 36-108]MDY5239458.1 alginate lyase family protein [Bacteroides helcogenes]
MKRKTVQLLAALLLVAMPMWGQSVWDASHLKQVKQSIDRPYYATACQDLKAQADKMLDAQPLSVMQKEKVPASGDKHDYMSQARYTWPDPTKPDGLPYITRDGLSNPEINKLDRNRLGATAERITTLSLAWYFTGDERYAQKATELIRVWFLNKDTRMNPNLDYAQVIPGQYGNKGRCYGLIDSYSFVEMLDGVALLEQSKAFTPKDSKLLKAWFAKLTTWMLTSEQGKEEAAGANNHSVAYDAQIIAFSLYNGNRKLAQEIISALPAKRIFTQIEPDGKQPHELKRTLAFHYSQYNLTHFIDILLMAKKLNISIDNATSADGRNFYKAMDFLASYVGKSLNEWPYQQISGWEGAQQNFCKDLYRTAMYVGNEKNEEQAVREKHYLNLYNAHRILNLRDIFNLLYVQPTEVDNAYAFAAGQLEFAMQCADKARKEEPNAARRRVEPRSINKDGSLAMIHPHDWCSGFFPGSLWQMYAYTHDDFWRRSAISWTWPIEEAKWHKGTHDLGFMMYDSFGKAYELTGERSYKDVVLQSARTLITRYSPKVRSIRSWDHNRDKWNYPVIIDNMMNLEMLFRATQLTGDSVFWNVAVQHANTTMKNHFRPDYSSYHVVDYNPETGAVRLKQTHQGYADDSFWSRGQGWALYGFAMCYRFTHDPAYLKQSEGVADFFLNLKNMPADFIPYWDMKMPAVNGCTPEKVNADVPRDASAAALIASGLYELCNYVAPEKGKQYRTIADKIVSSLNKHYQAEAGTHYGFLLLHSTGHFPGGSEVDVPLNYADYFYLEALARKAVLDNR